MTPIALFNENLGVLEETANAIDVLGKENPEKAYLCGIALSKLGDKVKKEYSDGFRSYYDLNKELPGGFSCQIVNWSKKYDFSQDVVWSQIKATLDARESLLKSATDLSEKGGTFTDPNTGEIVSPVPVSFTATSYKVTRK